MIILLLSFPFSNGRSFIFRVSICATENFNLNVKKPVPGFKHTSYQLWICSYNDDHLDRE